MGNTKTGVTVSRTVVDDTPEGSIRYRARYETPPVAEFTHPMSNIVVGTGLFGDPAGAVAQPPRAYARDITMTREEERARGRERMRERQRRIDEMHETRRRRRREEAHESNVVRTALNLPFRPMLTDGNVMNAARR